MNSQLKPDIGMLLGQLKLPVSNSKYKCINVHSCYYGEFIQYSLLKTGIIVYMVKTMPQVMKVEVSMNGRSDPTTKLHE